MATIVARKRGRSSTRAPTTSSPATTMEDYGTSTVLIITVIGTVIVVGIVVLLRSRQARDADKK